MVELYGSAFLTAYGERPSPLWLASISQLTDDECRTGFTTLAKQAREYPANLTQFMAACRPISGSPRYLGTPTTSAALSKLLDVKPASPEVADNWLAKMRRKVGAAQK